MEERRVASAVLRSIKAEPEEDAVVAAELEARVQIIQSRRGGFKKQPDTPLKEVLERKRITGRRFMAVPPALKN
jgi:hypothetical protein